MASGDNDQTLTLQDGSNVDVSEIGSEYVVSQSGKMPTAEIVDFGESDRELKDREKFIKKQAMVRAMEDGAHPIQLVDITLKEIAEEIAHLKYDRRKAIKNGEPSAKYTLATITSLRTLSDALIKKKLSFEDASVDFKSPKVQRLFQMFIEFFYHCMEQSGISKADIDLVFGQLQSDLPEWEKRMSDELNA
jgi:hypothetical protein